MRKVVLLVVGLVLVGAVLLSGCTSEENASTEVGQGSWSTQDVMALLASDSSQQTGVWVAGTGKVTVVPDIAILTLGVEAQASTVMEAQGDAAAAMTEVMAVLTANGVAEKDIQTRWYSISPVTKWIDDYKEQITIGYRVTNTVTVKVRDVDKTGTIIDAVTAVGGDLTRIQSISFTVDDTDAYYDEAREKAILDAMAKAEQIASVANVTLGKPIYISEMSSPVPPYPERPYIYDEAVGATTPISAGEMEISITVQMVYALQ
ncbi:MAG: SIMPL domain-containing protein [Dehalococcoidia bacterium]